MAYGGVFSLTEMLQQGGVLACFAFTTVAIRRNMILRFRQAWEGRSSACGQAATDLLFFPFPFLLLAAGRCCGVYTSMWRRRREGAQSQTLNQTSGKSLTCAPFSEVNQSNGTFRAYEGPEPILGLPYILFVPSKPPSQPTT